MYVKEHSQEATLYCPSAIVLWFFESNGAMKKRHLELKWLLVHHVNNASSFVCLT